MLDNQPPSPPAGPSQAKGNYFFTAPSDPPCSGGFQLLQGGIERCAPKSHFKRDHFDGHGLEIIIAGSGHLHIDEEARPLFTGHLILHDGKESPHSIIADEDGMTKCWIEFTGDEANQVFRECRDLIDNPILLADFASIRELFQQLLRIGVRGGTNTLQCGNRLLEVILLEIKTAIKTDVPVEAGASYQTYQRCLQHLEEDFRSISSATDLAKKSHVNAAYLSRLFNRFDTEQPYRKLRRLKMEGAARLVSEGQMLVKEVASAVGIDDQLHFSRLFKRHFGLSPRAYRQLQMDAVGNGPPSPEALHERAS